MYTLCKRPLLHVVFCNSLHCKLILHKIVHVYLKYNIFLPELRELAECSRFLDLVLSDLCIRTAFLFPGRRIFNFLKAWPTEIEIYPIVFFTFFILSFHGDYINKWRILTSVFYRGHLYPSIIWKSFPR